MVYGDLHINRELWDQLTRTRFAGQLVQCLLFIISKTCGIGKYSNKITLDQFSSTTNLSKQHVCRSLKKLNEMCIIVIQNGNGTAKEYRINLDFSCWKPILQKSNNKNSLPKEVKDIPKKGNEEVTKKEEASSSEVIPETDIPEENEDKKDMGRWW